MGLRCLLFCSDGNTAETIRQVLQALGVEAEVPVEAPVAVGKITQERFQIVIVDWEQPDSGMVLAAVRERKAGERPLVLAIVSDDVSVPKALQAGANSMLRKPLSFNQVKDTLATARDLIRAKVQPAATMTRIAAPPAAAVPTIAINRDQAKERSLRAGEFLSASSPGVNFVTESDVLGSHEESMASHVDPLKELEPMAAAVEAKPSVDSQGTTGETRGLEWYLKARGANRQPLPPATQPGSSAKPELIGYEQIVPATAPLRPDKVRSTDNPQDQTNEEKSETELFDYIDAGAEPQKQSGFRLGKGAIIVALVVAACAIAVSPLAPWYSKIGPLWKRGQQAVHAWLNPQPVTPVQAPQAHEDFHRAGDEYKLPVAETIPDATTDPSQISVVPVIDPTAKKLNNDVGTSDQGSIASGGNQPPSAEPQVQENPPAPSGPIDGPTANQPAVHENVPASPLPAQPAVVTTTDVQPSSHGIVTAASNPQPPKNQQPHVVMSSSSNVPLSLQSQIAPATTPEAIPKPELAPQSIEPVSVTEAVERGLILEQPGISYPYNARGQSGTVVLQVLVGRDGTVQDAKFMQGSLAFARAAIDGVRQWKFRPYMLNGRAVSVQSTLTFSFKPVS